jgi:hypothetical protein
MQASFECLCEDLAKAIEYFQENSSLSAMPFMHSFPKNACERSSGLLVVAFSKKYSNASFACVKGRNPKTGDMHFWIETSDFVIDPTAHQFAEFSSPFVCTRPSPLEKQFPRLEEILPQQFPEYLADNGRRIWDETLQGLCLAIHSNPKSIADHQAAKLRS